MRCVYLSFPIVPTAFRYLHNFIPTRSGLLRGDVLLSVNSKSVHDFADCQELLAYMKIQVSHFISLPTLFWS